MTDLLLLLLTVGVFGAISLVIKAMEKM